MDIIYKEVFDRIEELLRKDDKQIILAIDGMCGSGKSYLADLLAKTYDCNIFHMDDFFLPLELRTKERLEEPGGNVHYERFKEEILLPVSEDRRAIYRKFICGEWKYSEPRTAEPKRLNIIEGSYSLHPSLRNAYDLKIFLEVDDKEQLKRIALRNPDRSIQPFIDKWIPLENKYFSELNIRDICDIIIDTTSK
jgi:uridine kinase